MRGYLQRFSPRGGFEDFLEYWRQPTPYRWQIVGASVALTFTLMVLFIPESQRAEPEKPEVTWISTFDPDRTREEIIESNRANQRVTEQIEAEREAREEKAREAYKALGRATGLDVDAMEEQAERERAAEEAAADRAAQRATRQVPAPGE